MRPMGRMARSPQRYLALAAMLALAAGAAFLAFVWWVLLDTGLNGYESKPADWLVLAAAVLGLAATLAVVAGLLVGSPAFTVSGVALQASCAVALFLVWPATDAVGDQGARFVFLVPLAVGVADVLAVSSAMRADVRTPRPAAPRPRAQG
jgi:hypothetical protein